MIVLQILIVLWGLANFVAFLILTGIWLAEVTDWDDSKGFWFYVNPTYVGGLIKLIVFCTILLPAFIPTVIIAGIAYVIMKVAHIHNWNKRIKDVWNKRLK
jgi:hypothetical protein